MSTQCIYEVDWLLPFDLPRDSGNDFLHVEDNLEDLDIGLASRRISIFPSLN